MSKIKSKKQFYESTGREAAARSRRSVLCFSIMTSSCAYFGDATTTQLVSYSASHTLTKPHSSLAALPSPPHESDLKGIDNFCASLSQ
jgi:hypothetical protein